MPDVKNIIIPDWSIGIRGFYSDLQYLNLADYFIIEEKKYKMLIPPRDLFAINQKAWFYAILEKI
jgi:hypothetical protein